MAKRTERSRFRIGDLLVHLDRNVVVREGQEIRLEPMWMQVLVYLAENRDRVIGTMVAMSMYRLDDEAGVDAARTALINSIVSDRTKAQSDV